MRAHWQIAIVTLVTFAAATSAPACYAGEMATFEARIKPIAGTGTAEVYTAIKIRDTTTGTVPSPLVRMATLLPAEMYLAATSLGLTICTPSTLNKRGPDGCQPSAILGYGKATAELLIGGQVVVEHAHFTPVMGPPLDHHTRLLDYAEGFTPVFEESISTSTVAERTGPFGSELQTSIPLITSLVGAPPSSITSISYTIDPPNLRYYRWQHEKRRYYRPRGVSIPGRCPGNGYRFGARLTFLDKSTITISSTVPCSQTNQPKQ